MVLIRTLHHFHSKIHDVIDSFDTEFVIICGDWNLVLDPKMDTLSYSHVNNLNARKTVFKLLDEYNLSDPWRVNHPDKQR